MDNILHMIANYRMKKKSLHFEYMLTMPEKMDTSYNVTDFCQKSEDFFLSRISSIC